MKRDRPCQQCGARRAVFKPTKRSFKHPRVADAGHDLCATCERKRRDAACARERAAA